MSFATNNSVLYNVDQNFPESAGNGASKERARNNIGAASAAALIAETQRATDAEKAAKSEVAAGSGISVTSSTGSDGQNIYTVTNTSVFTQANADWNSSSGPSEILNKPSVPDIKTVTTTLPPVETDVSSMTLFDDGRVRVNNSTEVGLLAPTGTQSDNGKVLVGTYAGSPGKFTATWGDVSTMVSTYPKIDYMTHVTVNVNLSAANYLNMEDGVCYDVMSNAGGSFTLHLQTNSTTTVHSKIYLWGEQANCMSATIVYEDEGGEVSELQFVYGGTSANTLYALDVYARKVHVSGGISFDAYLCRVYDYPCASRDINSYNKDIGRVIEYVEPL